MLVYFLFFTYSRVDVLHLPSILSSGFGLSCKSSLFYDEGLLPVLIGFSLFLFLNLIFEVYKLELLWPRLASLQHHYPEYRHKSQYPMDPMIAHFLASLV